MPWLKLKNSYKRNWYNFPTFLQLLFGYHSLEELTGFLPDVYIHKPEAWPVLNSLFPKQASNIWPVS